MLTCADDIRRGIEVTELSRRRLYAKYGRDCALPGCHFRGPRRVRRVMGENGLLAPHRVGRDQEKTHDGTIVTDMSFDQ